MLQKSLRTGLLFSLALALLFAVCQCGGQAAGPDQVATQVAREIYGTMTAAALLRPTDTAVPSPTPTMTPTATSTPSPTDTPSATPTPTASRTPSPSPTPTRRPPTLTPRPTATPTPEPAVGDTVRCDDMWEIGVNAQPTFAKRLDVIDTLGYMTITNSELAKGEWMLFYFTLTNLQAETSYLSMFGDELTVQGRLDGKPVSFEASSWGPSRAQEQAGISAWNADVPPGITILAVAIFDVNPAADQWTLVLQGEEGGDEVCQARIRLDQVSSGPPIAVASGAINLRAGPGSSYAVVGKTTMGQRLPIVGRHEKSDWWHPPTTAVPHGQAARCHAHPPSQGPARAGIRRHDLGPPALRRQEGQDRVLVW